MFIRVYRLEKQLRPCWCFRTSFLINCPSNLLPGSPTPLPPFPLPVLKYSIKFTYREWVAGRGWGCWLLLETIFCRSLTLCIWQDSESTKLLEVPLHVKFCRWRHFALFSISLIFLRLNHSCISSYKKTSHMYDFVPIPDILPNIRAASLLKQCVITEFSMPKLLSWTFLP